MGFFPYKLLFVFFIIEYENIGENVIVILEKINGDMH